MEKLKCEKIPFTKKDAKTKIKLLISSGRWNKKQGSGRIYHCPVCKWWHITSKLDAEPIESYKEFVEVNLKHEDDFLKLMSK